MKVCSFHVFPTIEKWILFLEYIEYAKFVHYNFFGTFCSVLLLVFVGIFEGSRQHVMRNMFFQCYSIGCKFRNLIYNF